MAITRAAMVGAVALLEIGAAPAQHERVVTGDGVIDAQVNGVPARIRVDPGLMTLPIISAELAERAKLHTGSPLLGKHWGVDFYFRVGPTRIISHMASAKLALGSAPFGRRIAWNERRYYPDVDGVVPPAALPDPVVRFQLRAPRSGESTAMLPLDNITFGPLGLYGPSFAVAKVGTMSLRVSFAPRIARSYVSANTAMRVATELGGRFDGAAEPEVIAFGIARPVRPMALARPLVVGSLSLSRIGVRVAEGGNTDAIPVAGDSTSVDGDPNEVVVTARSKHRLGLDNLTLGADALARCSSIVFDKPAKQVRLTCA